MLTPSVVMRIVGAGGLLCFLAQCGGTEEENKDHYVEQCRPLGLPFRHGFPPLSECCSEGINEFVIVPHGDFFYEPNNFDTCIIVKHWWLKEGENGHRGGCEQWRTVNISRSDEKLYPIVDMMITRGIQACIDSSVELGITPLYHPLNPKGGF